MGTSSSNIWPPRPGVTPAIEVRAVLAASESVKATLASGDPLHQQLGVPAYQYAHWLTPDSPGLAKHELSSVPGQSLCRMIVRRALPRSRMQTKLAQSTTLHRLSEWDRKMSSACCSNCEASMISVVSSASLSRRVAKSWRFLVLAFRCVKASYNVQLVVTGIKSLVIDICHL